MIERFIKSVELCEWPLNAGPDDEAALREGLPRGAARRMTRLGLLCTRVLRKMPASPETAIVYATSMSETGTLETYLDSFPDPSPTAFQASIHPAGAQQALIALGRPTREFYPLSGGKNLLSQAVQTCFLAEASEVVLVAGEERSNWLIELGLAEKRSFAFALHLSTSSENAQAVLRTHDDSAGESGMTLSEALDRLTSREHWSIPRHPAGKWEWHWV